MSLIFKHPWTGGELHQAGASEIPYIIRRNKIDLIILAAEDIQPKKLKKSDKQFQAATKVYVPMRDTLRLHGEKLRKTIELANFASDEAAHTIIQGGNVLSTCKAGWNRSGLVSGLTLKKITDKNSQEIVRQIRNNRSIFALSNPLFVKIIHAS